MLKWHPPAHANRHLAATSDLLERARRAGWNSPRWLAFGTLSDGREYVIEELIDGARAARFDADDLQLVLSANRLQSGLGGDMPRDWSDYLWRVLWVDEGGSGGRLRAQQDTRSLLERILAANDRDARLPSADLVHGDVGLDNVLIREGRPWFIDAEHAGRGTRAYDLATMIYPAMVRGEREPSTDVVRTYEHEAMDVVGRSGLVQCVTASMIEFVAFGLDHWPLDVPRCVARCHDYLDRLAVARLT